MSRPRILTLVLLGLLAAAGTAGLWVADTARRERGVRRALETYHRAAREGDLAGLRTVLSPGPLQELEASDASLPALKALTPPEVRIGSIRFPARDRANAALVAGPGEGEAELVASGGLWRIQKIAWKFSADLSEKAPSRSAEAQPIPREVQALLDRMAGPDPQDGGRAWLELGARYTSTRAFRTELHRGFHDPRPIAFRIYREESHSGGRPLRYYSTRLEPLQADPPEARTVGEALRLDLWRMEGLGLEAGSPDPAAWWPPYAKRHGLTSDQGAAPAAQPAGTRGTDPFPTADPRVPGTGSARVTLDGRTLTFQLGTSFWTDTRMKDPTQATLDFRVPQGGGNPQRIRLRFDATRPGAQRTDGASVDLVYIADGGQMFPPAAPCEIRILSPYSGEEGSLLRGEVAPVRVHSAGIDHTVALSFEVRGSLQKRP